MSGPKKLTKTQRELLTLLRDGDVKVLSGMQYRCARRIHGLVEQCGETVFHMRITPAGRAALAAGQ